MDDSIKAAAEAAKELYALLKDQQKTLALAVETSPEGAAEGILPAALVLPPGTNAVISVFFPGDADRPRKNAALSKKLLRDCGAVSEEAAAVSAHLARQRNKADFGLAVTGIRHMDGGAQSVLFVAVSTDRQIAVKELSLQAEGDEPYPALFGQALLAAYALCREVLEEREETKALLQPVKRYQRYFGENPAVRVLRYFLPWPGDRVSDVFFKVLLIAAIAAGIWAATQMTGSTITDYHSAQVLEQAVSARETEPTSEARGNLPDGYLPQFAALYELNTDIAGWITIPDTNVNLPVMQRDDNDFYLSHDINREHDINGLPFMDFRNKLEPGVFSSNTLVYGHNMTSGRMFRDLVYYKDPAYYQEHPIVTFDTVYDQGQWVIFSCFEANTESSIGEVFGYFNFVNSQDPDRIQWYIDEVKARSYFNVDIDVSIEDKFLTLQTCANDRYETKVCVVARRLRDGESAESFSFESAAENPERVKPVRY